MSSTRLSREGEASPELSSISSTSSSPSYLLDDDDDETIDLGHAGEGVKRYTVINASDATPEPSISSISSTSSSPAPGQIGESNDGLEGCDDEAAANNREDALDRDRASSLRRNRAQQQRNAGAIRDIDLPYMANAPPAADVPQLSAADRARIRRERADAKRWILFLRVWCRWNVIKHVLRMFILPILCTIGAVYYYSLPPSNLSFAESLMYADMATVRYYVDTLHHPVVDSVFGDVQQRHPVHFAALGNDTSIMQLLIVHGADVHAIDDGGFTTLHYAAHRSNAQMVDMLLSAGADVNARDVNRRTALHVAAIVGAVQVMAVLIFNGHADMYVRDIAGRTPHEYSMNLHGGAMSTLIQGGYYRHPISGAPVVIEHDQFEAMKARSGMKATPIVMNMMEDDDQDNDDASSTSAANIAAIRHRAYKNKVQSDGSSARSATTQHTLSSLPSSYSSSPSSSSASSSSPHRANDNVVNDYNIDDIMHMFTGEGEAAEEIDESIAVDVDATTTNDEQHNRNGDVDIRVGDEDEFEM